MVLQSLNLKINHPIAMDLSPYNQNFDLDKNFITA
jgi:hypothetical protein